MEVVEKSKTAKLYVSHKDRNDSNNIDGFGINLIGNKTNSNNMMYININAATNDNCLDGFTIDEF